MNPGEVGSKEDCIVTEMLQKLDYGHKVYLAELLSILARGVEKRPEASVKTHVALLEKKKDVKLLKDLRPIALMSAVHKLFMRMWLTRSTPWTEPELAGTCCFRRPYQTREIVASLKHIFTKHKEWGRPVIIAKLDYSRAYDSVSARIYFECIHKKKASNASPNNFYARAHPAAVTFCIPGIC